MKTAAYAVIAVAILAAVCLVPVADSDAAPNCELGNPEVGSFDSMSGGKITIPVKHNSAGEFTLKILATDSDSSYKYTDSVLVQRGSSDIVLDMSGLKSTGTHHIKIQLTPEEGKGVSLSWSTKDVVVKVSSNPLSNWTTYAIIVVAVIAILIIVFMKMRETSEKKNKEQTMTFEELEAQRKAEMAAKAEGKKGTQPKASSTERKKYKAGKKERSL